MDKFIFKIPDYLKFSSKKIRILFIDNGHYYIRMYFQQLRKRGHNTYLFPIRRHSLIVEGYYRNLISAIETLLPDFIFTINFCGFDTKGSLSSLLYKLKLPVIHYLIDHPYKFLSFFLNNINIYSEIMTADVSWNKIVERWTGLYPLYLPLALYPEIYKNIHVPLSSRDSSTILFRDLTAKEYHKNKHIDFNHYGLSDDDVNVLLEKLKNRDLLNVEKKVSSIFDQDVYQIEDCLWQLLLLGDIKERYSILDVLSKNYKIIICSDFWQNLFMDNSHLNFIDPIYDHYVWIKHLASFGYYLDLSTLHFSGSFTQSYLESFLCGVRPLINTSIDWKIIYDKIDTKDLVTNTLLTQKEGSENFKFWGKLQNSTQSMEEFESYIYKEFQSYKNFPAPEEVLFIKNKFSVESRVLQIEDYLYQKYFEKNI